MINDKWLMINDAKRNQSSLNKYQKHRLYLVSYLKEVEIEEKFVEFNKRAFEVHLRLNKQLEKEHQNLHHIITDKSSHFIYLDEPELMMNEILKTIDN